MLRGSPFFVPLEYTSVLKYVREDNANLVVDVFLELLGREGSVVLPQSSTIVRSVVLLKQLGVDLASPISVRNGGRIRGQLSVDCVGFLVICQTLLHNRLNFVELWHKARRKHSKSHNLDETNVLFLNVMVLGMWMEDAKRMLVTGNVAAQRKEDLIGIIFKLANNRGNCIVRLAISLREDRDRLVGIATPCSDDILRGLECFFSAG